LPRAQDVDDLFIAFRRRERELDLAVQDQVKPGAGVAAVEQDLAFPGLDFADTAGEAGDVLESETVEQWRLGQQAAQAFEFG